MSEPVLRGLAWVFAVVLFVGMVLPLWKGTCSAGFLRCYFSWRIVFLPVFLLLSLTISEHVYNRIGRALWK